MTETVVSAPASEPPKAKSVKKKAAASAKAGKAKPSHPPTATMVNAAVGTLKERGGSSLRAIKKYISSTYKVDAEKLAPFIRKYIKSAVASGKLVQTKGVGAAGSFKLPGAGSTSSEGGKKRAGRPKAAAKKAASPKKEKKAPTKAKKVKKPPTTPKAPKPKKTTTKSLAKPKKPVPKKAGKKPVAKKTTPKKK